MPSRLPTRCPFPIRENPDDRWGKSSYARLVFGGIYKDRKNFFPNFAYEPATFLEMCRNFYYPPVEKMAFIKDRKGCVVGRKNRRPLSAGKSVIPLHSMEQFFTGKWDFTIRGIL